MRIKKYNVIFKIPEARRTKQSSQHDIVRQAMAFALRLNDYEIDKILERDQPIKCRCGQFARFLIKRNELGGQNGFRELEPELIEIMATDQTPFDVTARFEHN